MSWSDELEHPRPVPRCYIAAPRGQVHRARRVRDAIGPDLITSGWLDVMTPSTVDPAPGSLLSSTVLGRNLRDMAASRILLALTADGEGGETYVEIGRAMATPGVRVVWSGQHGGLTLSASTADVILCASDLEAVAVVRRLLGVAS